MSPPFDNPPRYLVLCLNEGSLSLGTKGTPSFG